MRPDQEPNQGKQTTEVYEPMLARVTKSLELNERDVYLVKMYFEHSFFLRNTELQTKNDLSKKTVAGNSLAGEILAAQENGTSDFQESLSREINNYISKHYSTPDGLSKAIALREAIADYVAILPEDFVTSFIEENKIMQDKTRKFEKNATKWELHWNAVIYGDSIEHKKQTRKKGKQKQKSKEN